MKKNMTRLGLAFALALSIGISTIPTPAQANTSQLNTPAWGQGKPLANSVSKMGVQSQVEAGISDCSLGVNAPSILSGTSTALNVTSTTGMAIATYTGSVRVNIVNTAVTDLVAFASMTSTSLASTVTAGVKILAGTSGNIIVANRDGITIHLVGLTATTSANTQMCNY